MEILAPLFIATGKHKYARMTIRFLWVLNHLDEEIVEVYNKFRVFSFSSDIGTGVAYDGVIERVRTCANRVEYVLLHIIRVRS